MTRRLALFLLPLVLAACADPHGPSEPFGGCLLAAVNQREVLRAKTYLHPAIPCRLLGVFPASGHNAHIALVYRLEPEGWFVYDDTFLSRPLAVPNTKTFPDATLAARQAFPSWEIGHGVWGR